MCTLPCQLSNSLGSFDGFEYLSIELLGLKCGSKRSSSFSIVNIYRPPSADSQTFMLELEELLSSLGNSNLLFCGDFNIDLGNFTNCATRNLTSTMFSHSMIPLVTIPTRVTATSATLIDQFWTNILMDCSSNVISCPIADHFPILTQIPNVISPPSPMEVRLRLTNESRLHNLEVQVNDYCSKWDYSYNMDVTSLTEKLEGDLMEIYNSCCPIISKKVGTVSNKSPWLNQHLSLIHI